MMNTSGFTYEVSTIVYGASYVDNQFMDSLSAPFDFVLPTTSSSTKYKLIGTDSLYFPAGGIVNSAALPGGTQQAAASGSKFVIHGDTLNVPTIIRQAN